MVLECLVLEDIEAVFHSLSNRPNIKIGVNDMTVNDSEMCER